MPLNRARAAFSHSNWLFELKWDGFRSLLHSDKDGVRLVSRNGNTFKSFPGLCEGLARDLGMTIDGKPLQVGATFEVAERACVVVGIMRGADSTFGSEVWAKRQLVGPRFGKEESYSSLLLRTAGADQARQMCDELTHEFKKAALLAQPEKEYYAKLSRTNEGFLSATYIVAVVMAVGGVFGVMNTMFAAISQRSRDTLPNPRADDDNPYVPMNMPAIGDLFDMFDFHHAHAADDRDRG